MKQLLKNIGSRLRHLLVPAILATLLIGAQVTLAAESPISQDSYQSFLEKWGWAMSMIGSFFNVILWVVIGFISELLNNDFIFGANMEDMLISIWQTVRNFVNIAFVFVLLVIALYNIVSIDTEKIPLKKSLGKVAIALVLVNFSFFACKVVLDTANILTTAVFALPRDIIQDTVPGVSDGSLSDLHSICHKKFYLDEVKDEDSFLSDNMITDDGLGFKHDEAGDIVQWEGEKDAEGSRRYVLMKKKCYLPNVVKIKLFKQGDTISGDGDDVRVAEFDQFKVTLWHDNEEGGEPYDDDAINEDLNDGSLTLSDLENDPNLQKAELTPGRFGKGTVMMILADTMLDLNNLTKVTAAAATQGFLGLTISGLTNLIMLLMYGVMFVAMFIVLLFRVVFLWICIAFSPVIALTFVFKDFGIDAGEFDLQKKFITYAFIPVKMGIALSVGILMIFKARQFSLGDPTIDTAGTEGVEFDIPVETIISDSTSMQALMWNVATLAVLWIAIKWSMSGTDQFVSNITNKIFGYVEGLGNVVAKSPLVLPIAPYGNTAEEQGRPPMTLGQIMEGMKVHSLDMALRRKIFPTGNKEDSRKSEELTKALDRISSKGDQEALINEVTGGRNGMSNMANIYNDQHTTNRVKLAEKLALMGVVPAFKEEIDKDSSQFGYRDKFVQMLESMPEADRNAFFGTDESVESLVEKWAAASNETAIPDRAIGSIAEVEDGQWLEEKATVDAEKAKLAKDGEHSIPATISHAAYKTAFMNNMKLQKVGNDYSVARTVASAQNVAGALRQYEGGNLGAGDSLSEADKAIFDKVIESAADHPEAVTRAQQPAQPPEQQDPPPPPPPR